ncbi:hypothetical protein ABXN37_14690 [Piscinibacter sakaiensis]|uniref:Uncharacterized protein n=1 Tax=Piscinibacter sakaiensis TaxID=1547922 RepID=A0A0K8P153_PISS1|nr:hypothetical protein [Piscinibacter sakaiensis]GAP36392.1 hypothetical protein ISF6_2232 [Piscinibacter sakaiensis]
MATTYCRISLPFTERTSDWLENHSPEEVRDAMLTIRCRGAGSVAEFEYLLSKARSRRRNKWLT